MWGVEGRAGSAWVGQAQAQASLSQLLDPGQG